MQINKFTDLSLRVLMYLSNEEAGHVITISEIAEKFDAPRNHLIKVVTNLNKLGFILATRGRNGGLKLAKPCADIKLGNVLQLLEHVTLIDCNHPVCPIRGVCNLKHILDKGLSMFYREMDQYSLKDVLDNQTETALIALHRK
ncbi:rrf2 family protein, putative transcriptional regulator [Methylophilaceae bacterium 11]|nr:rrf2 family protein, putative transcriptional regulator [Methylophilaceae bacterium 11]